MDNVLGRGKVSVGFPKTRTSHEFQNPCVGRVVGYLKLKTMKILLMLVALTVAPLGSVKAYYDADFSASCYEISPRDSAYLVAQTHYDTMGNVGFINFKGKDGIKLEQVYMRSSWDMPHTPNGFNLYVFTVSLNTNTVTLTENDFNGLPTDCKVRLTFSETGFKFNDEKDLKHFADNYWSDLKTNNKDAIISLYYPSIFNSYSKDEQNFIKDSLGKIEKIPSSNEYDSVDIQVAPYQLSGAPANKTFGVWPELPEYEIMISFMKNSGDGGMVGINTINAFAIKRDDRFYLVTLLPDSNRIKEIIGKRISPK